MATFTAFCRESNDTGTIWIETVEADDLKSAEITARKACAEAWERWEENDNGEPTPDYKDIHCLGLAEGDVNILMWEDLGV